MPVPTPPRTPPRSHRNNLVATHPASSSTSSLSSSSSTCHSSSLLSTQSSSSPTTTTSPLFFAPISTPSVTHTVAGIPDPAGTTGTTGTKGSSSPSTRPAAALASVLAHDSSFTTPSGRHHRHILPYSIDPYRIDRHQHPHHPSHPQEISLQHLHRQHPIRLRSTQPRATGISPTPADTVDHISPYSSSHPRSPSPDSKGKQLAPPWKKGLYRSFLWTYQHAWCWVEGCVPRSSGYTAKEICLGNS